MTMPHQLQCQHPPPKPPASLSTTIKVHSLIAQNSLYSVWSREKERRKRRRCREMERWRFGGEVGRSRQYSSDLNPLSVSLSLFSFPAPPWCRVSQPLLDRCVPDYTTFTTVGDWLDAIKMSRYRDNFVNAGFASFDLVAQMTAEWVELIRAKVIDCVEFESQIRVIKIDLEVVKITSWIN